MTLDSDPRVYKVTDEVDEVPQYVVVVLKPGWRHRRESENAHGSSFRASNREDAEAILEDFIPCKYPECRERLAATSH